METAIKRWETTLKDGENVHPAILGLSATLKGHLDRVRPVLEVPATKEQCLEAAQKLQHDSVDLLDQLSGERSSVQTLVEQYLYRIQEQAAKDTTDLATYEEGPEKEELKGCLKSAGRAVEDLKEVLSQFKEQWDHIAVALPQSLLQDLVHDQERELQLWFYETFLGEHLEQVQVRTTPNKGVTLDESRDNTNDTHIPPEIISLIFTHSPLEDCVVLRQLNSKWLSSFQQSSHLWKHKLRLRNPWIVPGGDLLTWQDCVLVFVSRLHRWTVTENMDAIPLEGITPTATHAVAWDLPYGERLPSDFSTMLGSGSGCAANVCEHFHLSSGENQFRMNPWTLEAQRVTPSYRFTEEHDEEKTVIEHDGMKMTLPLLDGHTGGRVLVDGKFVRVKFSDGRTWVLPQEKPHYEHGTAFLNFDTCYEAGPLFVSREIEEYSIVDFESKELIKYATTDEGYPTACYNGIVWWCMIENVMIPTMLDLENENLYYCKDKMITGFDATGCAQGSGDSSQFLAVKTCTGLNVYDLANGGVSTITRPCGWPAHVRFYPGWRNGKFEVWCMGENDMRRTRFRVIEEHDGW